MPIVDLPITGQDTASALVKAHWLSSRHIPRIAVITFHNRTRTWKLLLLPSLSKGLVEKAEQNIIFRRECNAKNSYSCRKHV